MHENIERHKRGWSRVRKVGVTILCVLMIWQLFSLIFSFVDIYSFFPLKTYTGKTFTVGYPQNWQVHVDVDDEGITLDPQYNLMNDFIEQTDSYVSDIDIEVQPADAHTTAAQGLMDWDKLDQRFATYKRVAVPETVTVGGQSWLQHQAVMGSSLKDGTSISFESIHLATVYTAKDGSRALFIITLTVEPDHFDRINTQVFQRILRSFTFR